MKIRLLYLFILLSNFAYSQTHEIVKLDQVEKILTNKTDTLYILNFWATWCGPCVKELQYFEELNQKYKNQKVKIILISMDFKSDIEKKLTPFLEKRKMQSTIWLLDETNQNKFIPRVEENWSGAIPFTLMIKRENKFKYWKEGELTKEEIEKQILDNL